VADPYEWAALGDSYTAAHVERAIRIALLER